MDKAFQKDERRIDLGCIRNVDSSISHILDKSDNVAFYRFENNSWHKQDIEGSLFVFARSVSPFYGVIILNRRSLSDNVIELLTDGLEFQRSGLYLLYKARQQTSHDAGIRSIWFENEGACVRISNLLNRLMRMKKGDEDNTTPTGTPNKTPSQRNNKSPAPKQPKQPSARSPNNKKQCDRAVSEEAVKPVPMVKKGGSFLDMFSTAHQRYADCTTTTVSNVQQPQHSKPIKIMKRNEELEEACIIPEPRPKSDDLSCGSSRGGIPITFQDLVNSVQPNSEEKVRPASCCSLEGTSVSSASVEEIPISINGESNSPGSSIPSNHRGVNGITSTIQPTSIHQPPVVPTSLFPNKRPSSLSETKLLLSPMDFLKTRNQDVNKVGDGAAKRQLFTNGTPAPSSQDLFRFKEVLIAALEEDDQLVRRLYGLYQKRTNSTTPAR
eukprot:sb/3464791/